MTQPGPSRTSQLREFEENIDYSKKLITGGIALEKAQNIQSANYGDLTAAHPQDLFRAAWSQSVAALDHWLHDEIIERAVRLVNEPGGKGLPHSPG